MGECVVWVGAYIYSCLASVAGSHYTVKIADYLWQMRKHTEWHEPSRSTSWTCQL